MGVAPNGHPRRQYRVNDRKIEHVHYPTHEYRRIAVAKGCELRYRPRRRFREYLSVKKGVDYITCSSGTYHCQQDDVCRRRILTHLLPYIPAQEHHSNDAEETEEKLASYLHAPRHTVVLDEFYIEPVGDMYLITDGHIHLDSNLDDLVNDEKRQP